MRLNLLHDQRFEPRVPIHPLELLADVFIRDWLRLTITRRSGASIDQQLPDVFLWYNDRRSDMRWHPAMIHRVLGDVPKLIVVFFDRLRRVRRVACCPTGIDARGLIRPNPRLSTTRCLLHRVFCTAS